MSELNLIYFLLGIICYHIAIKIPKKKEKIKGWYSIKTFRFDNEFDYPMEGNLNQNEIMQAVFLSALKCSKKKLQPILIEKGNYRVKFFLGANFIKKTKNS